MIALLVNEQLLILGWQAAVRSYGRMLCGAHCHLSPRLRLSVYSRVKVMNSSLLVFESYSSAKLQLK